MKPKTGRFIISGFLFGLLFISGCMHTKAQKKEAVDGSTKKINSKKAKFIKAEDFQEDEWALENYLISMGDILEISVWQVEELQREVVVRPDGKISFPLIGDVETAGRTIEQLRDDIVDKIRLYIKVPQVSINILEFGGKKAVVVGDVQDEGVIRFNTPTSVMEAVALAGGFVYSKANMDKVFVIRDVHQEQPLVIMVNANQVLKNGRVKENVLVRSGDIVYVTRAMSADFTQFMDNIFGKVVTYAEAYYGDTWRRHLGGVNKQWKYKTQIDKMSTDE
ncbi:MAG: polysaccharide export protein [Candidatus Omnitrophica bacterium]|nr:polysaccharide export protein [Candidatus Omnitrophota bacterium]MDD5429289.1 polysaccharide export protein [Candidatus Omnitrophota bacterium]